MGPQIMNNYANKFCFLCFTLKIGPGVSLLCTFLLLLESTRLLPIFKIIVEASSNNNIFLHLSRKTTACHSRHLLLEQGSFPKLQPEGLPYEEVAPLQANQVKTRAGTGRQIYTTHNTNQELVPIALTLSRAIPFLACHELLFV